MSDQRRSVSPYPYASDYSPTSEYSDMDAIPMVTPFQRYVIDSLRGLQGEVAGLGSKIDSITPRMHALEQKSELWRKAVNVAKYALPAIVLQLFPSVAKYVPIIVDAISKAGV